MVHVRMRTAVLKAEEGEKLNLPKMAKRFLREKRREEEKKAIKEHQKTLNCSRKEMRRRY